MLPTLLFPQAVLAPQTSHQPCSCPVGAWTKEQPVCAWSLAGEAGEAAQQGRAPQPPCGQGCPRRALTFPPEGGSREVGEW